MAFNFNVLGTALIVTFMILPGKGERSLISWPNFIPVQEFAPISCPIFFICPQVFLLEILVKQCPPKQQQQQQQQTNKKLHSQKHLVLVEDPDPPLGSFLRPGPVLPPLFALRYSYWRYW